MPKAAAESRYNRLIWPDKGVHRGATRATAEKGRIIFEAAVSGLVERVDELRAWPIEKQSDMHENPVPAQIRW